MILVMDILTNDLPPLLTMDYKLVMLAAVAVALIAITSATEDAKAFKCYKCTGGAADDDCAKATEGKSGKDTDCGATDKFCAKKVTYEKEDFKTIVKVDRMCATTCTKDKIEDKTTKTQTFCCDKENCNGVSSVSAGVTTVVLAVAAVFLKNLY